MKNKSILHAVLLLAAIWLPGMAFAQDNCALSSRIVKEKMCDSNEVYVGPNKASEHGGTCLKAACGSIRTNYNKTGNCNNTGNWVYAGVSQPKLHGGHCVKLDHKTGQKLLSRQVNSKNSCAGGEAFVGPNKPGEHGGTCLSVANNPKFKPTLPTATLNRPKIRWDSAGILRVQINGSIQNASGLNAKVVLSFYRIKAGGADPILTRRGFADAHGNEIVIEQSMLIVKNVATLSFDKFQVPYGGFGQLPESTGLRVEASLFVGGKKVATTPWREFDYGP